MMSTSKEKSEMVASKNDNNKKSGSLSNTEKKDEDNPFSMYYAMLTHQQNMLQDYVRTGTYERAIVQNAADFRDKVVLDVGTGSGILAYFAVRAGARKVYAVEASKMAEQAEILMKANGLEDRIKIVKGKIEEIELPEKVDIVISEPMGFLLVHERMLESYVAGREKWMKPGGLMFPSVGNIYMTPFTDDQIFAEQMAKVSFWQQQDFYGLNLSALASKAVENHFSQPIVGYFTPAIFLCNEPVIHAIDFGTISSKQLQDFEVPFRFQVERTAIMHGLACWFDVSFNGTVQVVTLSTGPEAPGTHWYQCRLLLSKPIAVNATQFVTGSVVFKANAHFSYNVELFGKLRKF